MAPPDHADATHLRDQQLQRLQDPAIFEKAVTEQRIILTFDLDFGEILANSRGALLSVILFRLANTTTDFVIGRLQTLLADPVAVEALRQGAIIVSEDGRYRIRRLPLGR